MKNRIAADRSKLIMNGGKMIVAPLTANDRINHGYPGKSIMETVINGFFTINRSWTVQYWNKAAEKLSGLKAKEMIGKNIWEKFSATIPMKFHTMAHKAFLQDAPVHFKEYWHEMQDSFDVIIYHYGDNLSVSFKSSKQSVIPDDPKHPAQTAQIVNELYRFVTEVTNDCLWEWDLTTREIFWIDGGHKRIFGYPIENALIPQSFWESCLHPDDKLRITTGLNKIIKQGSVSVWEDEYRFKKSNGDYAWVHDRGHIIYDGKNPSRMIGATQDIMERVVLQNKLESERPTRHRELTAAVFTAQENERAEIGKELHDNLGQILAVSKMYMQMASKDTKDQGKNITKSCDFIGDVIVKIRDLTKNLVIPEMNITGLVDNIKNLVYDMATAHSVKIEFDTDGIDEKELNENLQINIFRIVQEQMANILKHAKATHASIHLTRLANKIVLDISDNGKGCNSSKENTGVGILNIRSRAELLQGRVTIISAPGKGFDLKVELPLQAPVDNNILKIMPE